MRIIIVEDEDHIRNGMSKMIETRTEHTVVSEASNGQDGLEAILRFKPDLVITDIRMPKMDGLEMLEKLEGTIDLHKVVLSGYQEFDYAQKAIKFGVSDYLLKPLAPEDVVEMLEKIENKIKENEKKRYSVSETRLRDLLFGYINPTESQTKEILEICEIKNNTPVLILIGYIGDTRNEYKTLVDTQIIRLKEKFKNVKFYNYYNNNTQLYYCILVDCLDCKEALIRCFRFDLLIQNKTPEDYPVWAIHETIGEEIFKWIPEERNWLLYSLIVDLDLYTKKDIDLLELTTYDYPYEIVNEIRNSIYKEDNQEILNSMEKFFNYVTNLKIEPSDLLKIFTKFYYGLLDILLDFDKNTYEILNDSNILSLLEKVRTKNELSKVYKDIINILINREKEREDISNYIIKKVIKYIRKNYKDSITLDEISRKLKITPVYLSTLFNREMGISFSTFLKQFRISHAKRLLKSTNMKIYEVAYEVGYSDPKYFMKVFKEEEGISPSDFRNL